MWLACPIPGLHQIWRSLTALYARVFLTAAIVVSRASHDVFRENTLTYVPYSAAVTMSFDYHLRLPTERRMVNRITHVAWLTTALTTRGGLVRCVRIAMHGCTMGQRVKGSTGS